MVNYVMNNIDYTNLALIFLLITLYTVIISSLSVYFYKRGLKDKTLLPDVNEIVTTVVNLIENTQKTIINKNDSKNNKIKYY